MYLLIVAVILTVLKYMEIAPVADWSWWIIIGVYAATAVWWQVADVTGYSKRKSMEKEEQIRKDRQQRNSDRLKQSNQRRK
jgi:small Trp-rich protein